MAFGIIFCRAIKTEVLLLYFIQIMEEADAITGCAQTISRLDVAVSLGLIASNKVR